MDGQDGYVLERDYPRKTQKFTKDLCSENKLLIKEKS